MRKILHTTQFKRDSKRLQKRGHDFSKFRRIVEQIARAETLNPQFRDHPLRGTYQGARECHVEPDWLLIYERAETEVILIRTGTHADLFSK